MRGFHIYGVVVQLLCSYSSNDCVLVVHFELFRLPREVKTVDCGRNSESGKLLKQPWGVCPRWKYLFFFFFLTCFGILNERGCYEIYIIL